MSRYARATLVTLATLAVVVLAAVYPWFARSEVWGRATWVYPFAFLLLVPLPVMVWKMTLGTDARVPQLSVPTIAPLVRGPRGWRTRLRDVPGVLRGAALTLAIAALARPQNSLSSETAEERGIDIVILLDMSGSMKAIMDQPTAGSPRRMGQRATRIDTAKDVVIDFIGRRSSDRIGVVVFARAAFVLSPPTLDYGLVASLVKSMSLGAIDENGTAIGDAVGTGVARLRRSDARSKAIILLTDGDNKGGSIDPMYAAHLAQTHGVRVYTVQIGNGDEVDVEVGVDLFGQPRFDRQIIPVNPELLKKIASETGGDSFIATDRQALEKSMHNILDHLEKTRFTGLSARTEDLFSYLLIPAVVLIVLEALVRLLLLRRFP